MGRGMVTGQGRATVAGTAVREIGGSIEHEVRSRYARAAEAVEPGLCCAAADYDREALAMLPAEIVAKDYGCGDPSKEARQGEVVVDLGSGAGKVCYLIAQKVGARGRVIGLDFNDAMLALARKYQEEMAGKLGYRNVSFHKAKIQDMALDLDEAGRWLGRNPARDVEGIEAYRAWCERLREERPLVANGSADLIVSNCVLNLVNADEKARLFREMHRVLKVGGRAVISDIVCDEEPGEAVRGDPELWSGCIAGAFREERFLAMFEEAGFYGIEVLSRQERPWRVVDGVEFRAVTVRAYKGKAGPCLERNQAVVYRGPWRRVLDDDGHSLERGQAMAVCDKTYRLMTDPHGPYAGQVIGVEPREAVAIEAAKPFDCRASGRVRSASVLKDAAGHMADSDNGDDCCRSGSVCC